MSYQIPALNRLIEQFQKFPSVGFKSAQKMAYYVMSLSQDQTDQLTNAVLEAKTKIHPCKCCQCLTEEELCSICNDATRDRSLICVVGYPQDVFAIERTREFRGVYHVLHGVISPLNGIGPESIKMKELMTRLDSGQVKEIIMATDPSVEGEATATYISRLCHPKGIKVTRLAYGMPVGGSLEYSDAVTLTRALEGRNEI